MRARQLEVFTAVMRVGTVTGAARVLNISQPALSQVLIHTEDELGFALFRREKGRLHPTPEALELYPEAERLFAGLEGIRRKTSDLKLGRAGLVRLATSAPAAMSVVPQALAAYRAAYPEVRLRAHVAPLASLLTMLRAGDAALALAMEDRVPPDIHVEVLGQVGFCCLLPEDHPLGDEPEVSLSALREETLISYRANTRPHDALTVAAQAEGVAFASSLEIDSSISAVGFVQAGIGVAVVDALLPWAQFAGLRVLPLRQSPSVPLSLLTLREKALSRAEEAMAQELRRHCAAYI